MYILTGHDLIKASSLLTRYVCVKKMWFMDEREQDLGKKWKKITLVVTTHHFLCLQGCGCHGIWMGSYKVKALREEIY
jgi:hypothetical protein